MSADEPPVNRNEAPPGTSRREFVALAVGAGLAAASARGGAADPAVLERDVEIKTSDGVCDAAFFHPASGIHPGVLIWTDIFGLRPVFRDFGRRLAASGYAVLVPNPFYRTQKAPVISDVSSFDFQNPDNRAKLGQWTGPLNAPGAAERDAVAFVAFLDAQPAVARTKKIGTQGYCMGGPLVVKTAASVPERVGAGASFHGGGLVTDKPDSPHLLSSRIKGSMYFAIAASDDAKQPDAKTQLRAAFDAAHVPAVIEVYADTQHGWCVPDMPLQAGKPIYDREDAERAWTNLLALYAKTLV
jgi:carboxymethylenebutenolidase